MRAITEHTVFVGTWPQLTAAGALLTALSLVVLVLVEVRGRCQRIRNAL